MKKLKTRYIIAGKLPSRRLSAVAFWIGLYTIATKLLQPLGLIFTRAVYAESKADDN